MTDINSWQQQAHQFLIEAEYAKAANLYEQAIEAEPDVKSHYWYLGLMLLLQGKEEEATTTWLLAMVDGTPEQMDLWTAELVEILASEANRQAAQENYSLAWLIRGHIREIQPTNLSNLLKLIQLAIAVDKFTGEEFKDWEIIQLLATEKLDIFEANELLEVLKKVLDRTPLHPLAVEFTAACVPHLMPSGTLRQQHQVDLINLLLPPAIEIGYSTKQIGIAISLLEICREINQNHPEVLRHLAAFYQNGIDYAKGIELAQECYSLVQTLPEKIFANHLRLRGMMSAGGYWEEVDAAIQEQKQLIAALVAEEPSELPQATVARLFTSAYFLPYFSDRAAENRQTLNQLSQRCQCYFQFQTYETEQVQRYYQQNQRKNLSYSDANRLLKIGYISHCLKSHSVGWLARWLFQYHNRDQFQIYAYMLTYKEINDPLQEWYISKADSVRKLGSKNLEIAEQIYQDGIDILIDLDSITMDLTCEVMALKPAPIQVTWLGWDASGLPTIDYFIADPYVLPDNAQDYYREKIWRLPQTYIAVDGFEVAVPTLRREDLNIPTDAILYFTGQKGYKRHPDTSKLQMKIIKEVANSYLLIKGFADQESIKNFFIQLATEHDVNPERLRFLPNAPSEPIHRANLDIADVVLDTYPYNGATTTMETLWMGIPMVTRVGEQFAARNSYTMMINAGITEGIAWTDDEYVEWGIRLGKDEKLRQDISWRLRQGRQTAPLWNAKQFTREMEKAYQQMWEIYVQKNSG